MIRSPAESIELDQQLATESLGLEHLRGQSPERLDREIGTGAGKMNSLGGNVAELQLDL